MRFAQGIRARPIGTVLVATVSMLAAASQSSGVVAQDDQAAGAVADGPARIIRIELRSNTYLVGNTFRADISICDGSGANCKPATRARVTTKPKGVLKQDRKRGTQVLFTARKQGEATITAKQGGATGTVDVRVNRPPQRNRAGATDVERLVVVPEMADLRLGQELAVTAWSCLPKRSARPGDVELSDGLACRPTDISEVNLDPGSPLSVVGQVGPTVILRLDTWPGGSDEGTFVGAQIVTVIGGTLPSLVAVNEPYTGPAWADVNLDGVVDELDRTELVGSLPTDGSVLDGAPEFDARLDLTRDRRLDAGDLQLAQEIAPGVYGLPPSPASADVNGDGSVSVADFTSYELAIADLRLPADAGTPNYDPALDFDGNARIDDDDGFTLREAIVAAAEARLGGSAAEGQILGDINGDGAVDADDQSAAHDVLSSAGYDERIDVNGDGVVDEADWQGLIDLIDAHGNQPSRAAMPTPPSGG